jgi:hypothetical protein
VVGAAYVKENSRRGGTAVCPKRYRRLGVAESLVRASFEDFPEQYSILARSNSAMRTLLIKMGFRAAASTDEVQRFTKEDFSRLSDFAESPEGLTFKRFSPTRQVERETLILMYRSQ